jgi:hypothetical protein
MKPDGGEGLFGSSLSFLWFLDRTAIVTGSPEDFALEGFNKSSAGWWVCGISLLFSFKNGLFWIWHGTCS